MAWLRQLLLLPPAADMAGHISAVCSMLSELQSPLPELYAGMPATRIAELLAAKQGNQVFFQELTGVCRQVGMT